MTIGEALRERRERFGLSCAEVARIANLATAAVEAAEADAPGLTIADVEALGRALVFDPAMLLRGEPLPDARRLAGWFRSHTGDDERAIAPSDVRLFALAAELGEIGAFLAARCNRRFLPLDRLAPASLPPLDHDQAGRQGYAIAVESRRRLAELDTALPEHAPLTSIQAVLEQFGVHVARVSLQATSKYAVTVARPGAMPVVLLNAAQDRVAHPLSRRAVLAHELAHLLLDSGERDLPPTDRTVADRELAVEQRANGFAPAFIAPPAQLGLPEHLEPERAILRIAAQWGFTVEGAIWHAKNCGVVDDMRAQKLIHDPDFRSRAGTEARAEARKKVWEPEGDYRDPRDLGLDVETSALAGGLIEALVLQAWELGHISAGRVSEILTYA